MSEYITKKDMNITCAHRLRIFPAGVSRGVCADLSETGGHIPLRNRIYSI